VEVSGLLLALVALPPKGRAPSICGMCGPQPVGHGGKEKNSAHAGN
jgi:hypothetical protein